MYAEETHDGQKCIALCWIVYPSGIYGIIIVKARLCACGFEGTQNMKTNSPSSRAAIGISIFRVASKDDEYSINWMNNIVVVITRDTVMKAI